MKTCLIFLVCLLALAACVPFLQVEEVESRLPNKHFLVFNQNLTEVDIQNYLARIVAQDKVVVERYLNNLAPFRTAIVVDMTPSQLNNRLQEDAYLEYVHEDSVMTFGEGEDVYNIEDNQDVELHQSVSGEQQACSVQTSATWGISRVCYQPKPAAGETARYHYSTITNSNVHVYVLDTGIQNTHNQFEGRAFWGANFISGEGQTDGNGHGTHCAGTIAAVTYGVCKSCRVWAIKVLSASGSGSNAGVVSGIDWLTGQCKGTTKKCVGSMSLGGGANTATDTAVNNAFQNGVLMVVAAGNNNADANNYSPARATGAMTVGATQQVGSGSGEVLGDQRSSFSNYGSVVNIFAPGTSITSCWIGSNTATNTISGTSMACPHAAGVAAKYWMQNPTLTASQVRSNIYTLSTKSEINMNCGSNSVCNASPNYMLWNGCVKK